MKKTISLITDIEDYHIGIGKHPGSFNDPMFDIYIKKISYPDFTIKCPFNGISSPEPLSFEIEVNNKFIVISEINHEANSGGPYFQISVDFIEKLITGFDECLKKYSLNSKMTCSINLQNIEGYTEGKLMPGPDFSLGHCESMVRIYQWMTYGWLSRMPDHDKVISRILEKISEAIQSSVETINSPSLNL